MAGRELGGRDGLVAAEQAQDRVGQGRRRRRHAAGQRARQTPGAAPEHRGVDSTRGCDRVQQVCVRLGVEHRHAGAERLAVGRLSWHAQAAQLADEVGAGRRPGALMLCELDAVASHPCLERERWRQNGGTPRPGRDASGQFDQRVSAQQAVDLLERDACRDKARHGRDRGRAGRLARALAGGQVQGGILGQQGRVGRLPEDVHGAGQRNELGCRIERAGQVVGEKAECLLLSVHHRRSRVNPPLSRDPRDRPRALVDLSIARPACR